MVKKISTKTRGADKEHAELMIEKAKSIVLSDFPPNRVKDDPTWYVCKFCTAAEICYNGKQIETSCRTCVNVGIEQDGWWSCTKHGIYLAEGQQKLGCNCYEQQEM